MAKFKKSFRRASRGFKKSYRAASKPSLKPMDVVLGGLIYGAARPFAAKMLPDMFSFGPVDSDNVIIGAAGLYGMKKGKGLMKALGAIALGSEAGIVAARVTSSTAQSVSTAGADAYEY